MVMYGEKREKFEMPVKKVDQDLIKTMMEYREKVMALPQPAHSGNVIIRDHEGKIINNIDISSIRDLPKKPSKSRKTPAYPMH